MGRILVFLLPAVAVIGGLAVWFLGRPNPVEVTFVRATRQTLTSTIVTNGRVEPIEFAAVRAARDGALERLSIRKGDTVRAGQAIAQLAAPEAASELAAAQARAAQAQSELAVYDGGGSRAALTEIDTAVAGATLDLEVARREAERAARLVERNAETRETLLQAGDRVRLAESRIEALRQRRAALLPQGGRQAAESRLREAESAVALARSRATLALIAAPLYGIVYNLAVQPGAFVRAGDLIADVGRTETVRAVVYIDEPELGRVAKGMPVRITWDAAGAREWEATVERLPTQIVTLGSRQVGEVLCSLPNQDRTLPPGANVNAEVRSAVASNVIAIPKAALRRQGAVTGVYALAGQTVEWRPVQTGISSITHSEITSGLKEGDPVALPSETPVKPGEPVLPKLP